MLYKQMHMQPRLIILISLVFDKFTGRPKVPVKLMLDSFWPLGKHTLGPGSSRLSICFGGLAAGTSIR